MKVQFLQEMAKSNPALARLIEVSIISWVIYILWAVTSWNVFDMQALSQAMLVPILVYMSKLKRDLENMK